MHGLQSAAGLTQTQSALKPEQSWEEKEPENITITHLKVPLSAILNVLWFEFPFDISVYRQSFPLETRSGFTFNTDLLEKVNMSYHSCQACLSVFWLLNLENSIYSIYAYECI